jgi:hypothetical protein
VHAAGSNRLAEIRPSPRPAQRPARPPTRRLLGVDETRFGRPRWVADRTHDDGRTQWLRIDPWDKLWTVFYEPSTSSEAVEAVVSVAWR